MSEYILEVRTQKDLDAIPDNYLGFILINFGTSTHFAEVRKKYIVPVEAIGYSHVKALNNSHVKAKEHSFVIACDNAEVEAFDDSTAIAMGNIKVIGFDNSLVITDSPNKIIRINYKENEEIL